MSAIKVEVEVGACKLDNDGSSFLDYSFEVVLTCVDMFDKRLILKSTRTLLDFCDLESRLMSALAEHNLLSPFHTITMGIVQKHLEWRHQKRDEGGNKLANKFISLGIGPEQDAGGGSQTDLATASSSQLMQNFQHSPIFGGARDLYLKSKFDESIGQENLMLKSTELGVWMLQVLREPSVLESPSFASFFSTAEKCYRRQQLEAGIGADGPGEAVTEYSFLLPVKHLKTKTVLSKHTEKIEVQRGQIVLWRFTSSKNDVAFSVELDGRSLLGGKKYPSSREELFGSLEMVSSTAGVGNLVGNGLCELKFDNKFAKLMTPTQVKFYCRAVDPVEYLDCKRRAAEKVESSRRKKEALDELAAIFAPRAAYLREESAKKESSGRAGADGREDVSSLVGNRQVKSGSAIASALSSEILTEGDTRSDEELIADKSPEEAVRILLAVNAKLRTENEELSKKCTQLQSKIDVVLNFANTNSGHSASKKASGSKSSANHKRRQTYAAHGDQPLNEEHKSVADDSSLLSSKPKSSVADVLSRPKAWEKSPPVTTTSSNGTENRQAGTRNDTNVVEQSSVSNTPTLSSPSSVVEDSSLNLAAVDEKKGGTHISRRTNIRGSVVIDMNDEAHKNHTEVAVLQHVEGDSDDEDSD